MYNRWLILLIFLFVSSSCETTKDSAEQSSDKSFAKVKKVFKDKNYEMAISKLQEYRAKYPFSKRIADVDLMIADAHFLDSEYEAASHDYRSYVSLHPSHSKVEYARYQTAECFWRSAPEKIDRESEFAKMAIKEWRDFQSAYPNSEYNADINKKKKEAFTRLAKKVEFISKFYCQQKQYHSCALRAEQLVRDYASYPEVQKSAVTFAAKAYRQLAKEKAKDPKDVSNILFRDLTADQLDQRAKKYESLLSNVKKLQSKESKAK